MAWCRFVSLFSILRPHVWKAPVSATQLCTVLLCSTSHAWAGGSFQIRVLFSIKPKWKNGRKNARSRPAGLLYERFATARFFLSFFVLLFFFFLATKSQVGGRQREKLIANGDLATGNFEHWVMIYWLQCGCCEIIVRLVGLSWYAQGAVLSWWLDSDCRENTVGSGCLSCYWHIAVGDSGLGADFLWIPNGGVTLHATERLQLLNSSWRGDAVRMQQDKVAFPSVDRRQLQDEVGLRTLWETDGYRAAALLFCYGQNAALKGWLDGEHEENTVGLSCLSRTGLNAVFRWLLKCARIPWAGLPFPWGTKCSLRWG